MTGGFTGLENTKSTEIFTAGASSWTQVGDLPHPGCEFRATNVNNVIYLLGKYHLRTLPIGLNLMFRWKYGDIEVQPPL